MSPDVALQLVKDHCEAHYRARVLDKGTVRNVLDRFARTARKYPEFLAAARTHHAGLARTVGARPGACFESEVHKDFLDKALVAAEQPKEAEVEEAAANG